MLPVLDLIQLALHDSPCGEPYWVCIRIIACPFFSPVFFFLPLLRLMAYGCLSFFFFFLSEHLLLDLCDLTLELVRVWPFYLFFF
ncbi:hypothetical protein ACN38_g3512 [Penicillium nordicum]|uniref:Uncharacterized protein n=1 Tax=Penicillium nordicum TaxID=229535 RepID=A0A0M8PCV2_9EURO|nr:hypothetical protein ACN38_g3512 [Penicillium nordicum]